MNRKLPSELPKVVEGFSEKLLAATKSDGLCILRLTDLGCVDEGDEPYWITACSEGWSVDQSEIVWWVYVNEAIELLEGVLQ